MFTTALDFYHFVQPYLFCGQIAHNPSPSRGIEGKTILAGETEMKLRVTVLKQPAGSEWAAAETLRTAALSLDYLAAEFCASVWCRSINTRVIDGVMYDASRIVTKCLCHTPIDNLPILSGIQPAELRWLPVTLSLANSATLEPTTC